MACLRLGSSSFESDLNEQLVDGPVATLCFSPQYDCMVVGTSDGSIFTCGIPDEMLDAARADAVCAVRAAMEGLDMSSTPELEKLAADDPLALLTACVVQRVI